MIELVGTIGSLAFAISGVPAAYAAIKAKTCSYPKSFLALWGFAELLMIVYAFGASQHLLLFNYFPNLVCLAVLTYFNEIDTAVDR